MKQRKVKAELVLETYKDYVRHFGVKLGAKKWREKKLERAYKETTPEVKKIQKEFAQIESKSIVEEVRVEEISLEKAKGDIRYRADKIRETLLTIGWKEYIRPRMQACIDLYKSVYDDVPSYEELKVNQAVRKELRAILQDIDGWINAVKELEKEEEKDAVDKRRQGDSKNDEGSPSWQSER